MPAFSAQSWAQIQMKNEFCCRFPVLQCVCPRWGRSSPFFGLVDFLLAAFFWGFLEALLGICTPRSTFRGDFLAFCAGGFSVFCGEEFGEGSYKRSTSCEMPHIASSASFCKLRGVNEAERNNVREGLLQCMCCPTLPSCSRPSKWHLKICAQTSAFSCSGSNSSSYN